jgi:DNA-binding NarL/FixJ family response regulator
MRHFVDTARRGRAAAGGGATGPLQTLSPRENDVLRMLAEGLTDREIAAALVISPRTVETHVAKLYRKLDVRTRIQAVSRAVSLGLIELR